MIFAAGLGTRLRPYTNDKPKALVAVNGTPMLGLLLGLLERQGIDFVVINVHHYAEKIVDYVKNLRKNLKMEIHISDESDFLLDTGGGLLKAKKYFLEGEPFLVHNVDVISEINFQELLNEHQKNGNAVTLAVRNRKTSRYFLFDSSHRLCGWKNMKSNEIKIPCRPEGKMFSLAFSGIQIIDPLIFNYMDKQGKFSITNFYIDLAAKEKIGCYRHDDTFWMDLGTIEKLDEASKYLKSTDYE